jgi:biopolymer transport protein ExbD
VPELQKLQAKKEGSSHKSAASENYFSYSDRIQKQLAFISFTKIKFTLGEPKFGVQIYFDKNNLVFVNKVEVKNEDLPKYLAQLPTKNPQPLTFCFDKNSSYESFVKQLVSAKLMGLQVEHVFVY